MRISYGQFIKFYKYLCPFCEGGNIVYLGIITVDRGIVKIHVIQNSDHETRSVRWMSEISEPSEARSLDSTLHIATM